MPRQEKSSAAAAPDPVLQRYAAQFRALRAQLAELGFFCKGTVLARRMTCGKSACACATEPARRHGPYFEWTYKLAGKTVNVRLAPDAVAAYRAGTAEWRRLRVLLTRLENLSRRAIRRQTRS
jgi:hypothetical protein